MSKREKTVFLNVPNFGVNLNKDSENNLFKYIKMSNFKKIINIFSVLQIIDFKTKTLDFRKELFDAFNLPYQNFLQLNNLNSKVNEVVRFAAKKEIIKNNYIFLYLHLDNEFDLNNADAFIEFLENLQKKLWPKAKAQDRKFRFYLNLLIDKPIFNWAFLKRAIFKLQKSTSTTVIIHKFIPSENLLADNFQAAKFYELIENWNNPEKTQIISSIWNAVADISKDHSFEKTFLYDRDNDKKLKEKFAIFVSFQTDELSDFYTFYQQEFPDINSLHINLDDWSFKANDEKVGIKEFQELETVLISKNKRNNFLTGLFPHHLDHIIISPAKDNPYYFVRQSAKLFYESLKQQVSQNKKTIVLNWNIFQEVKEHFSYKLWMYAAMVFDVYISKILFYLSRKNIKWILFSDEIGFERLFSIQLDEDINLFYLSNQLTLKNTSNTIDAEKFKDVLVSLLSKKYKSTFSLNLFASIKVSNKLKKIEAINSDKELIEHLNLKRLQKTNKKAFDEFVNFASRMQKREINHQFRIITKGIANPQNYSLSLNTENMYLAMYFHEKDLYQLPVKNIKLGDLILFYKSAEMFLNLLKEGKNANLFYKASGEGSYKREFFNRYSSYINQAVKRYKELENLPVASRVKYLRKSFLELENLLLNLQNIKIASLKELEDNYAFLKRKEKEELLIKQEIERKAEELLELSKNESNLNLKSEFQLFEDKKFNKDLKDKK
ncbi:hypothetical protein NV226_01130 [Mycoplasma iguanae]|uniref:Uncharacterized protein n=1 Tax=Mycoplasma iguanae TaxID=292461 RepID=A0ABY5RAW6_9MOLU|nr:hypothetical protein [Mycoplasma iguanae]UVD81892.1 hypothetical protein NV226_01130 [Mycoplasma iguanae]